MTIVTIVTTATKAMTETKLGLVTFETLITILTIENLNPWQSLLSDNQLWHWTALIVTLDSIRNSCDVYNHTCQLVKSVMMIIVVSLFNRIQLDSIGEERRGRVWHDAAIQVRHKCNTMMDAAIQPLVEYTKYNTSCNTSVTQVWKQRWVLHKNLHKAAIQAPVQRYTSCDSQQCNLQVVQCNKKYKKQWNTGRTVHKCKLHKHSKTKHIQQVGKLTVYKCKLHKFSKTWERTLYLFRVPPFLARGANYLLIVEMQLFLYCDQIKYFEI